MKQLSLTGFRKINPCFGGTLLNGNNPKHCRPIDSKQPIHLVLRARTGGMRNPQVFGQISKIAYEAAEKHGVRIYEYANVGNHIHILIRIGRVHRWAAFIRELTGRIALLMKRKFKVEGKFWLHRPFTRIISGWKKAYEVAKEYVLLNLWEAEGFINRRQTKTLKDLRALLDFEPVASDQLQRHRRSVRA